MTTNRRIRAIILCLSAPLIILSHSVCGADSAKSAIEKTDFTIAVNCRDGDSPKLCLGGKFKAGIDVILLQSGARKICAARTTSAIVDIESNGNTFTELSGSCDVPKGFAVAILKKTVRDYELLIPKKIIKASLISKTDRSIRSSGALLQLLKQAQDLIPGEMKELDDISPQLHQIVLPDLNVNIASYDQFPDNANYVSGPRVIVINSRVFPLTGWCSYRNFNVFRLNGRHYVQSGSCCCGCGITIMEVFQITPNGLIKVISDDSLSD
jgi:hypothetical protein